MHNLWMTCAWGRQSTVTWLPFSFDVCIDLASSKLELGLLDVRYNAAIEIHQYPVGRAKNLP